ncbi:MAG: flagellar hook-associated protein FlgK [Defluviitaleaceae bacterium]|nr:flagellar hook-associated protein FlgK [Defluviitaleaceae bacterium]
MRSAFFGLHVATSGLHTARGALNVTSHNIANAEIPGFSRQVANKQAWIPLRGTGRGMYGTGSHITSVVQIRDRFLDRKFWHQNAISGQFTAVNQHLSFVETVFNQLPNVGVKRTFNVFFSTIQDLTTRAHEPTFRTNVVVNAHTLTEQIRQNAFALQRQQADLNREFADVVHQINSLGSQITDLNRQIHIFERDGSNANDLRDRRNLLIDELSLLVNVQVEERDHSTPGSPNDRRLSVLINGHDFVNHTNMNRLQLVARDDRNDPRAGTRRNEMDAPHLYEIFFESTRSRFDIHSQTLSGKLRGIVDVRDGNGGQITASPILSGQLLLQQQLDALLRTQNFIGTLNTQLATVSAGLDGWITQRDDALAVLGGTANTAQARAWALSQQNVRLRTEWNELNALHESQRTVLFNNPSIRGNPDSAPPRAGSLLRRIETAFGGADDVPAPIMALLNSIDGVFAGSTAAGFDIDALDGHLAALHAALTADPDFNNNAILNTISSLRSNIETIGTTEERIENFFPVTDPDDDTIILFADEAALLASLEEIDDALRDLNEATTQIGHMLNFSASIEAHLHWAIGNAEQMAYLIEQRIFAIESRRAHGDVDDYLPLLQLLRGDPDDPADSGLIAEMQAVLAAVSFPDSLSVYSSEADLNDFLAEVEGALADIAGFSAGFDALEALFNGLDEGREWIDGATTNFKGIPFYMNQLNQLVRTFARAINEGRNVSGEPIPGAIGHIFGYDANGNNRNALFFTAQNPDGSAGLLVDPNDPFASLRLWIMSEVDEATGLPTGVPARNPDGSFVTVADPNPPILVNTTDAPIIVIVNGAPVTIEPGEAMPDANGNLQFLTATDTAGRPLFTIDYSQFNALNFMVNPELIDYPELLAASSNHNIGLANNDLVHGILAIANDNSLFREGRLIDFIIATSNHLAINNHQAALFRESYHEITTATHNLRLSVKSVDTEEEMLNLVRFQNMFIAASRVINVIDTVYDTLINRLGNF